VHTHLWAQAASGVTVAMSLVNTANVSLAATPWIPTATLSAPLSSSWELYPLASTGSFQQHLLTAVLVSAACMLRVAGSAQCVM
jgi:hypothetical protein